MLSDFDIAGILLILYTVCEHTVSMCDYHVELNLLLTCFLSYSSHWLPQGFTNEQQLSEYKKPSEPSYRRK